MPEDGKFCAKPRVRFSQTTNIKENLEDSLDKKAVTKKNLPKIKNIVTIKTPVKVLNYKKQDNIIDTNILSLDDVKETESVNLCDSVQLLPERKNDYSLEDRLNHRTDNEESSANVCNIENLRVTDTEQVLRVGESFPHEDAPTVTNNIAPCKVLKPKNNMVTNISNLPAKNSLDKGKENKNFCTKRSSQPITDKKVKKPLNSKLTLRLEKKTDTSKVGMKKSDFKKHNTTSTSKLSSSSGEKQAKKTVGTSIKHSQKNSSTKLTVVNVMPCHKYKQGLAKASPVKKSVVHDIVAPNVKACVEPSVPIRRNDVCARRTDKDTNKISNIISSEKLLHPEYNSIMCTVTKLNEAKKERVVTDTEHLPTSYKNLVNGKISSVLDFSLNEVIYKNLVDLSVNEKQFPYKMMRSKDPQPRQRDLVPQLSDFFIPESAEEYYTSMCVKPRTPDIVESWNAFRISDKICEWKDNVDN